MNTDDRVTFAAPRAAFKHPLTNSFERAEEMFWCGVFEELLDEKYIRICAGDNPAFWIDYNAGRKR